MSGFRIKDQAGVKKVKTELELDNPDSDSEVRKATGHSNKADHSKKKENIILHVIL